MSTSKSDAAITDAVSGLTIIEQAGPSNVAAQNKQPHSILSDETLQAVDTRPKPGKRPRIVLPAPSVKNNTLEKQAGPSDPESMNTGIVYQSLILIDPHRFLGILVATTMLLGI